MCIDRDRLASLLAYVAFYVMSLADTDHIVSGNRNWREAATLVIVAHDPPVPQKEHLTYDYRLLLLQRSNRSRSFPGVSVFPGGVVDDADFSQNWLELFKHIGIQKEEDFGWDHMKGKPRAGPIAAPREEGLLPNDVAFRICAIRETFEESGVLLAGRPTEVMQSLFLRREKTFAPASVFSGFATEEVGVEWQQRVHKDASQFRVMCGQLGVVPNLWSLFELSNILTPSLSSRRFDTLFYICTLETVPKVIIDNKEMVGMQWLTPEEGIKKHCRQEMTLFMPQLTECARLCNFLKISEVQEYSARQMDQGMEPEMPVVITLKDCYMRVLSGDDCYPESVPLDKFVPIGSIDETVEENMKRCRNFNRFIRMPNGDFRLICNVKLPFGQQAPRCIDSRDWANKSKL